MELALALALLGVEVGLSERNLVTVTPLETVTEAILATGMMDVEEAAALPDAGDEPVAAADAEEASELAELAREAAWALMELA